MCGWKETIVSYGRNAEPPDQLGGRNFCCTEGKTEEVNKRASRCKLPKGLQRTGVTKENQGATHFYFTLAATYLLTSKKAHWDFENLMT